MTSSEFIKERRDKSLDLQSVRAVISNGHGNLATASTKSYLPSVTSSKQEPAQALHVVEMVFYAQALREQVDTRSSSKRRRACSSSRKVHESSLAAEVLFVS